MELIRRGKHARGGGADGYGRRPGAGARRSSVNCATERDADGRSVRVKRQMHMMMMDRRAVPVPVPVAVFVRSQVTQGEVLDTTSHSLAKAPFPS